ncbi:4'-phosphopantetheinyl transferase superfamily protein [Streptomyces sp. NPDC005890]|uniref:4'-phosphopantetheinyl transferase family protein n=1 Tax=Streptomyces sp. NPDC005890 TaxID=3154568 RepID=UPI0033C12900
MTVLSPAPDVWVLIGPRQRWTGLRPAPADRTAADGLPPARAAERLAGRAALRELLRLTRPELADAPVVTDPRGKPWLAGHPEAGISVSHDGGTVAAALALRGPVGVDVQHAPLAAAPGMVRRCLGRHAPSLDRLRPAQRARELAWVWSAQEACVKAAGSGLSGRPWTIDVPAGRTRGRWREYRWVSFRGQSDTPLSCAFFDPAAPGPTVPARFAPAPAVLAPPPAHAPHVPKG